MTQNQKHDLNDLIKVMAKLRDPNGGCPWDLEQDFKSIAPYTLEEAYEVADAIDKNDMTELREELGDLLFQSIYHAQMASEQNAFDIHDVIHDITAKMIHRHPHVFDKESALTPSDVNKIWDSKKAEEKTGENQSILDSVPRSFPALLRAHKLQKKAAKVGFEWDDISGVINKLEEEVKELNEAQKGGNKAEIEDELGDMFFVMVNFARMSGFNAEEILRQANNKFERRFRALETALKSQGKDLKNCTLEEMEAEWQNAKKREKAA
jgi:ATP diphosphatase